MLPQQVAAPPCRNSVDNGADGADNDEDEDEDGVDDEDEDENGLSLIHI